METIKWLLQKAFENDFTVSISKTKKGDAISLKIEKKISGRLVHETVEINQSLLNRIEATSAGSLVSDAVNKVIEAEKKNS